MKPEDVIRLKELLPTTLGAADLRVRIAGDILRRSIFSARMASATYLAKIPEIEAGASLRLRDTFARLVLSRAA